MKEETRRRIRVEVRDAAAYLDCNTGWHDVRWYQVVSLDRLDMSSMRRCVLGQLYGHFLSRRALTARREYSRAFVPMPWQADYVRACWTHEIAARRLADVVGDASRYVPANPYLGALERIPVT